MYLRIRKKHQQGNENKDFKKKKKHNKTTVECDMDHIVLVTHPILIENIFKGKYENLMTCSVNECAFNMAILVS